MITTERIAELRAIIAAATPGPWLNDFGDFCYAVNDFGTNRMQFSIDGGNIEQGISGKKRTPKEELRANVSLAQAARNDLPQALDTIEAQQRRIEELEAALKPFAQAADTADKSDGEILKTSREIFSEGRGTLSDYRASYFGVIAQDFRAARAALQPKETK